MTAAEMALRFLEARGFAAECAAIRDEIDALRGRINALGTEIAGLRAQRDAYIAEASKMADRIGDLKAEREAARPGGLIGSAGVKPTTTFFGRC